jgi:hypothetical protein
MNNEIFLEMVHEEGYFLLLFQVFSFGFLFTFLLFDLMSFLHVLFSY